jgi:ubiquinone/menaquinone biosynthesis C-methylase UbiE
MVDTIAKTPHSTADAEARVASHYEQFARRYDLASRLLLLVGFRDRKYREAAVEALHLRPGARVVEIGCGSGQNLQMLHDLVGPTGHVVGLDLTPGMLEIARSRVARAGWTNVELVCADAAEYAWPDQLDGVVSTFALSFSPRCGDVIREACSRLAPGGVCSILDQKRPAPPFHRLLPVLRPVLRSFAIDDEFFSRRPWIEIREAMAENLVNLRVVERYFGYVYLARGQRRSLPS